MSNGKLEYSLGLSAGGFLSGITAANQGLQLVTAAASALGSVFGRVFAEIERGGALNDLSNRTGETVGNLFKLQFAFEQSGVAASSVPSTLLRFQKSLSGVGEMGESTTEAFDALGLSAKSLAGMDSPEALLKIFGGLNKLDRNSATGAASTLFGRGSAGDILQLARDSKDVGENFKVAAEQAALFQRNAAAFDAFGDSLGRIKLQAGGIFAGLAEDITPVLNSIGPAIEAQDLGGLVGDAMTVGFGESLNFLSRNLQRIFAGLPEMASAAMNATASGGSSMTGGLIRMTGGAGLGAVPGFGPLLHILEKSTGGVSKSFDAMSGFFGDNAKFMLGESFKKLKDADLVDLVDVSAEKTRLKNRAAAPPKDGPKKETTILDAIAKAAGTGAFTSGSAFRIDANALQKIGLFGSTSTGSDTGRMVAGIGQMVGHLAEIRRALAGGLPQRDTFVHNI